MRDDSGASRHPWSPVAPGRTRRVLAGAFAAFGLVLLGTGSVRAGKLSWLDEVVHEVVREAEAGGKIVARGGDGAVAEIAAIGRASLLVPFPHAADDH